MYQQVKVVKWQVMDVGCGKMMSRMNLSPDDGDAEGT